MNEIETQRLNDSYRKFAEGEQGEALRELRELARGLNDPWSRTALLYHESLFLIEMKRIPEARQRLEDLKSALESLSGPPHDDYEDDLPHNLAVMSRYTELKILLAEEQESRALEVLEELLALYPKQLSIDGFEDVRKEIATYQGLLLADAGRWKEAMPILENATPPEAWSGVISYYLGHGYYTFQDYKRAEAKLEEGLSLGLALHWEGSAHYILGLVEYHLGNMIAANREFKLCLNSSTPEYLYTTKIWEWLEATASALGLHDDAQQYRQKRIAIPPNAKPN
jgi:tetratricopeptide (TPR) repeat protein